MIEPARRLRRLTLRQEKQLMVTARRFRQDAERLAKIVSDLVQRPTTSKSPALEELRRDAKPGHCLACDAPLPRGHSSLCGSKDCDRVYSRIYRAGLRAAERGQ